MTVTDALERKLYIIRKSSGHAIQALKLAHGKEFYVPSMSARTVCYKGMLLAYQVGEYYKDLQDPRVESALALVHQRFSTNTFPSWDLAHPFRMICHNGEINTLRGNVNWIRARQGAISSPVLGKDLDKIWPLIYDGQSDSASFDNALELLVMGGYSVAHAMMMMIPEAWENHTLMDPARRAFYEYHAAMMEPWDGPASIAFTDGRQIGATLDRNGLRPSRYIVTDDDLVIMGSECGCLPVPEEKIVKKWRLQPGKMFLVDLEKGRIIDDKELKESLAGARPYAGVDRAHPRQARRSRDRADTASEARGARCSTGSRRSPTRRKTSSSSWPRWRRTARSRSAPWATTRRSRSLSNKDKTLYHYFKQLFAQVTNPPIDPIREELVTSLVSFIGPKPNLLGIDEMNPPLRLEVSQPVLDFFEMEKIRHIERYTGGKFRSLELDITYPLAWGKEAVEARLASLCAQAEDAVRAGYSIIVISDRLIERERVAIPALLALSAIHQHLVGEGIAHQRGPGGGDRLGARGASLCAARRLRGRSGSSLPRHGDRCSISRPRACSVRGRRQEGDQELRQGDRQGPEEGDVEDGHLDLHVLHRRADLRGGGPGEIAGRQVFHRDHLHRSKASACSRWPRRRSASTRRRSTTPTRCWPTMLDAGGEYAWRVRGEEHMWTPDAIAKLQQSARAEFATPDLQGIRRDHQRPVAAPHDLPRPVRIPLRRAEAGADRGSRARGRDRQALLDRRDVARLDLGRGAHHARRGDEPHRRQVEHRRGRRGPQALRAGEGRRDAALAPRSEPCRARHRVARRRHAQVQDQAGRLRAVRRHRRVPRKRRADPDQDRAGRQARRRRAIAGAQGAPITSPRSATRPRASS